MGELGQLTFWNFFENINNVICEGKNKLNKEDKLFIPNSLNGIMRNFVSLWSKISASNARDDAFKEVLGDLSDKIDSLVKKLMI